MENQLFNLKKIRELLSPIEQLQSNINQLENSINQFNTQKNYISTSTKNETFLTQINDISNLIENINVNFKIVLTNNINSLLYIKNKLTNKYKKNLKDNLKKVDLKSIHTKSIGQSLIEKKSISKIKNEISYTPSVSTKQWLELIDALNRNILFANSAKKLQDNYLKNIKNKLTNELEKIPNKTPPSIIEEFKAQFNKNHDLTYEDFLKIFDGKFTEKELQIKEELVSKRKQKQEIEELKKKQEEQTETYESYLKLSEEEFERKLRKRKREKLTDVKEPGKQRKLELSDEVTEKIQKFKMKFDKDSNDNFLTKEENGIDPIKIIRERKRKNKKEYQKYKNHFESD
ncbi:MAG: hypothetical protein EAX91_05055 [Candidatus Lokiarchaeota archaeon]|nr:hypothetical protein [Candidatus Lokiarchaeota archaeon]